MFILVMTACEEVVDRPFVQGDPLLVVEGVLTNELKQHSVKLGWSFSEPDGKSAAVSGASVQIIEGATTYTLTEDPLAAGEYLTPVLRAVSGRIYTLRINYSGQDYTATDSSKAVEPMAPLQYRRAAGGIVLTPERAGEEPNYIRHEISWKNTPACVTGACEGLQVFYDLKTVDVQEGTKPPRQEFVFPAGATVVRRKYSVSPAYKSFLHALLSETEWRGSAFDVDRANLPTNLTNGATGFFAVTTVIEDSTVVE